MKLYCKDTKDRIRVWEIKAEGDSLAVRDGLLDGKMKDWTFTKCTPKNTGKANQTSPEQQAELEVAAQIEKKLKKKYFKTLEEAVAGDVFSPMLAHKFEDNVNVHDGWVSQPKLDGLRATAIQDSEVNLLSRERRLFLSCRHIQDELSKVKFTCYIDGELYNHSLKNDFNKLVSLIKKQKDISPAEYQEIEQTVQYHVYDAYFPDSQNMKFIDRHNAIKSLIGHLKYIVIVPYTDINSAQCIEDNLDSYLAAGYEGQMLRKSKSVYKVAGRSKDLLKHKMFIDEEFEIVDIEAGLGGWSQAAKKVKVLVDGAIVGCGIDGERDYLINVLQNKDYYIGKMATVKYFGRTPDNSLRFPVVKDIGRIG